MAQNYITRTLTNHNGEPEVDRIYSSASSKSVAMKLLRRLEKNCSVQLLEEYVQLRVLEQTRELEKDRTRALQLAERDRLTELANRYKYQVELERFISHALFVGTEFKLVLFDLDGFKKVNDQYGHQAGDEILKTFSSRLSRSLRSGDFCARLGGDEFAAILPCNQENVVYDHLFSRLQKELSKPVPYNGYDLSCGVSIGFATFPANANNSQDLYFRADIALYEAKAQGKGSVVEFCNELESEKLKVKELGKELELCLANNDLDIWFQPIAHGSDRLPTGIEALLRWEHPKFGHFGAMDVLEIAHSNSITLELSRSVIATSLSFARSFLRDDCNRWVSINLTNVDLKDEELPKYIISKCKELDVPTSQVKFEVTEHALIEDIALSGKIMRELCKNGFRFSIDDFGTGYSNLLTLSRLPFCTLKIDRTFIADMFVTEESFAIVRTIIQLAKSLNLSTIAEGVERADQKNSLLSMGCEYLQGYLVGRPISSRMIKSTKL